MRPLPSILPTAILDPRTSLDETIGLHSSLHDLRNRVRLFSMTQCPPVSDCLDGDGNAPRFPARAEATHPSPSRRAPVRAPTTAIRPTLFRARSQATAPSTRRADAPERPMDLIEASAILDRRQLRRLHSLPSMTDADRFVKS